jgi:hypothetical protein
MAEPAQRTGEGEHDGERGPSLEEVHDGKRLCTHSIEEQRADTALTDRESRHRHERQADHQSGNATLTFLDAQEARTESHMA